MELYVNYPETKKLLIPMQLENFSYHAHLHNCLEFSFCTEGEVLVSVDGNVIRLGEKCGILIPPNSIHSYLTEKTSEYYTILVGLDVLPELSEIKLPERERFSACGYAARLLSLFALGSAAPRDAFSAAMHRLKTDADIRTLGERALELVGAHTPCDRYTALKLLSAYSVREAELAIELGVLTGIYGKAEQSALADALASGIAYRVSALNIGGRELMALGIFGKRVGEVLSELLDAVMRGECENTAEALLLRAKGFLGR